MARKPPKKITLSKPKPRGTIPRPGHTIPNKKKEAIRRACRGKKIVGKDQE